jgi:L-serine/L-threonine ammonia-lyase
MTVDSGREVWLKLDAVQPSGSFKIRGIGWACREYARRGARRFISSSGGNAGIAAAHAGRRLGIPVVVVVPESTTARARALIESEGAEVVVHGASWQEANALAESMVSGTDAMLHPFDDPLVWEGHGSLVDEIVAAGLQPDAVVLSVGGGGLLSGVVQGMRRHGWTHVPVVAAETEGADSLARAMEAGHLVTLDAITSVATSLGAKRVCTRAWHWARHHPIRSVVVSDRAAVRACQRFMEDHRLVVEPSCGASLAAVYEGVPELRDFDSVLVVVCGGATATADQIREWAER